MANEYLKRTPTSTGNRRVFTWSTWIKRNTLGTNQNIFCSTEPALISKLLFDGNNKLVYQNNSPSFELTSTQTFRDVGSWMHILFVADTTASIESQRVQIFVNGVKLTSFTSATYPAQNTQLIFNYGIGHWISSESSNLNYFTGEFADIFFIDGQALTPDVFGFYKEGKGYISAGSTQATDFRPGQWVPKSPRIIKSEINRRGGFGVNGFYLPMNSSNNFGADFHTTPNTILKLKEDLPQPKAEIDGSGDYTNALRDDPFKQYLVLAVPGVIGGLQSGYGDYSATIKGSGSNKTFSPNGNATVSNTSSYYGSALSFDGTGDYFRTTSNISDFQFGTGDFTIESWIWKSANGNSGYDGLISLGTQGSAFDGWFFEISSTRGYFFAANGQWVSYNVNPNTSQWNHVVTERYNGVTTIYLNGVAIVSGTNIGSIPTTATSLDIGGYSLDGTGGEYYFNGYIQDLRVYKGISKYTGGFDVPKLYTPVGIATWRAVPDCTANNFATLNPLAKSNQGNFYYTNGNLTTGKTVVNYYNQSFGTIPVSSGKWYWEVNNTAGLDLVIGISNLTQVSYYQNNSSSLGASTRDWVYASWNGNKGHNGFSSYGSTFQSSNAIIGIALDMDNGTIEFYNNGTSQGIAFSGISVPVIPVVGDAGGQLTVCTLNFGQNPTFSGNTTAGTYTDSNGKGLFKYQPPTGFLALCEDNLPTPVIADPGEHFKTVLWTGDGGSKSITGVGFKPDMVWVKQINATRDHQINDSVRGPGFSLYPNLTLAETYSTARIRSFDSDGFSIGDNTGWNQNGGTYVAWCWKAGGEAVTNTDGTITSQVSVNQDAGFSIVSWTGNGTDGSTIGHGLNKAPNFIISKSRQGTSNWVVLTDSVDGSWDYLYLNLISDKGDYSGSATDSIISLYGTSNLNRTGETTITYCWAEIEGFSKFGSYVANGSADGAFVYLGFKPAWVMIKCSNVTNSDCTSGGYNSWGIYDSSRDSSNPAGDSNMLWANRDYAEGLRGQGSADSSYFKVDLLSNGFKIRGGANCENNSNGATYIFAAFAESPFQTANSK